MKPMTNMPPTLFAVERATAASRAALFVGIALVLIAASLPFWGESSWMREFVEIACYFIFAMMWNLLAGYGGMVSIGQQAFFGFGGYVMLMLGNFAGLNPFVAVPLGALAAGLVAVPVSFVAFRLSGGYFAIGTWVIAEVFRLSFANVSAVGGGSGTTLTALRGIEKATRESTTYWMALACVVAAIALVYLFLRSKRGLALLAIRDNEVAAESQGIPVARMKLAVYVVAAFGAGLAGALVLRGQPAHQPRCGLQRQLDGLRHLHGGHRRHRAHRRAAGGRAHLLGAQQVPERLRHVVPAGARAARDPRHAVLQTGPLGLRAAALGLVAVSDAAPAAARAGPGYFFAGLMVYSIFVRSLYGSLSK
jgi:branched-chain amino acid transport system permease protein